LRRLSVEGGTKADRKTLHQLRLLIKSIRYQEEWARGRPFAKPSLIRRLKHTQKVLGDYEDLVHFRKMARTMNLRSLPSITKTWHRARARARALPAHLVEHLGVTAGPRIRLVDGLHASGPAAR